MPIYHRTEPLASEICLSSPGPLHRGKTEGLRPGDVFKTTLCFLLGTLCAPLRRMPNAGFFCCCFVIWRRREPATSAGFFVLSTCPYPYPLILMSWKGKWRALNASFVTQAALFTSSVHKYSRRKKKTMNERIKTGED